MKYHLFKMIGLFFLFSCTGRSSFNQKDTLQNKKTDTGGRTKIETVVSDTASGIMSSPVEIKKENTSSTADTTWFPFSDSSYRLKVHIFNSEATSEDETNSVINYNHVQYGKTKQIFRDSLFCMDTGYMLRQDFNNDQINDILIFCYSGARANPSYHLYLVDTILHRLTYVKGFEELPNPDLDSINNVIVSIGLSGVHDFSFYQINSNNKLIKVGHGYEERDNDSTQYERAIRKILKDRQKREAPGPVK
jgi:hypothetical protein